MSATLADIVRQFNLQPGQSVRETVDGHTAELRLLDDELTPGLAEGPMENWSDIPNLPTAKIITVFRRGEPILPEPIHFYESDLAPE